MKKLIISGIVATGLSLTTYIIGGTTDSQEWLIFWICFWGIYTNYENFAREDIPEDGPEDYAEIIYDGSD